MSGVRIVISAGSSQLRKKIGSTLAAAGHLTIGESDNGSGTLRLIQSLQPDVAVVDIDSPQGLHAAKMLEEDGQVGLILIGTHLRREYNTQVVSGLILKPVSDAELLTAINFSLAGQVRLRKMADELAKARSTLETRKLVEKAKGILMDSLGIKEAEAYKKMQQQSMNKRVTLKHVAEAIITAHEMH